LRGQKKKENNKTTIRHKSPSRNNKNISQASNKYGKSGGTNKREQNNRLSMDSYGKVQTYINESNNNSLEGSPDSQPSIDKNQRVERTQNAINNLG